MIYVFIPYYNEDTPEFKKSLESQTYKDYRIIRRDRKRDKIYWTKAVRDFQKEVKRFCGAKDDDIVCVMNNDIEFNGELFELGSQVKSGEIFIPADVECFIDFSDKSFKEESFPFCNCFIGRCFFMTLGDFKRVKFSRLLPHALADIDFSIRALRICKPVLIHPEIKHKEHTYQDCSMFSLRSYNNPILWTIFLLKHPNRYTFINILKSWYEVIRLFRKS